MATRRERRVGPQHPRLTIFDNGAPLSNGQSAGATGWIPAPPMGDLTKGPHCQIGNGRRKGHPRSRFGQKARRERLAEGGRAPIFAMPPLIRLVLLKHQLHGLGKHIPKNRW